MREREREEENEIKKSRVANTSTQNCPQLRKAHTYTELCIKNRKVDDKKVIDREEIVSEKDKETGRD